MLYLYVTRRYVMFICDEMICYIYMWRDDMLCYMRRDDMICLYEMLWNNIQIRNANLNREYAFILVLISFHRHIRKVVGVVGRLRVTLYISPYNLVPVCPWRIIEMHVKEYILLDFAFVLYLNCVCCVLSCKGMPGKLRSPYISVYDSRDVITGIWQPSDTDVIHFCIWQQKCNYSIYESRVIHSDYHSVYDSRTGIHRPFWIWQQKRSLLD